jgi:CDP-diacylglycerol--serine O-phosphatidyltransferase
VARVWRRRRSLDTPRPAGRRWARLRRSGSRATQVLAQVTRRRRVPGESVATGAQVVYPRPDRSWMRITRRSELAHQPSPVPVSPAPPVVEPPRVAAPIPLLPGERTPGRRLKFAIANGCTLGSLFLGMGATFLAMAGELRLAAIALLACVVFDGCDGGLARRFGVVSPFGAQMDSLADLGSFGAATAVVVYRWLVAEGASPYAAGPACALVAACAAIRLARFNVSPKDGRFFCGVPTTMAAAVLALNILIGPHAPVEAHLAAVVVCALAMVTSFPYAKLSWVVRLPLWVWVVPAIAAMISVPATFAAVVGAYLISGPMLWLYQSRRPAFL